MWQKEKLLALSKFFYCHYVFKKPSAAEALKRVYIKARVNKLYVYVNGCSEWSGVTVRAQRLVLVFLSDAGRSVIV